MNMPPMAWVILALGLSWLVLRWWQQRQATLRAEARDARMAELLAEREGMEGDATAPAEPARETPKELPKERVCLGCRTVNPGTSTTCAGCGLEL